MKNLGYLFVSIGFLVGAFAAVRQPIGVSLLPFFAGLSMGVFGVFLVRWAMHAEATDEELISANIQTLESSLKRITAGTADFAATKATHDVYEMRHFIDSTFRVDLAAFAEARESIAHSFGLQAYSEVMSRFAAGERYLNRVWSASTDGYIDEANAYIDRAAAQFEDALQTFDAVRAR